jgi:thymidine phosphorylase
VAAWRLGAGRARREDPVDPAAGVRLLADPGDPVRAGQPLAELHTGRERTLAAARAALDGAVELAAAGTPRARPPLLLDRLDA